MKGTETSTTKTPLFPIKANYHGSLNSRRRIFARWYPIQSENSLYYYRAARIKVTSAAQYQMYRSSTFDTYDCLYRENFDSSLSNKRLIRCENYSYGYLQLLLSWNLNKMNYTMLVTSFVIWTTGNFPMYIQQISTVAM